MFKRIIVPLIWLLVLALAGKAGAIQLGDTQEEIEARYDTAPLGDHPKGIAIYQWDLWKLEIHYQNDAAKELIYTKIDPLTDEDIRTILDQNGGVSQWHPAVTIKNRVWSWLRSDGASAMADPNHDHVITLQGGRMPVVNVPVTPSLQASPPPVKPAVVAPEVKTAAAAQASPSPSAAADKVKQIAPKAAATPVLLSSTRKGTFIYIIAGVIIAGVCFALRGKGPKKKPGAYPFAENANAKPNPRALYMVPTLETLEWQQFELLMGEVFRRQGYEVEVSSGDGADGGVDLRLKKEGALVLAQCKQYLSGKVSVVAVREFYGVIKSEHAAKGIFINTSIYTQDAVNFAAGKESEMELLDGDGVRALIAGVTKPGENIYDLQRWIGEFRKNVVITHPNCQFCSAPMVLRTSKAGGSFWGCPSFPQCTGTRDARMDLLGETLIQAK